jgi:hypothetical protein
MFHPKHVELFAGNKILYKKVSFCWNIKKGVFTTLKLKLFSLKIYDIQNILIEYIKSIYLGSKSLAKL